MGHYFGDNQSIYASQADQIGEIVGIIANHYIGENPPQPVTYRGFCNLGIKREKDYRYQFNLGTLFPKTVRETCVYAWSKLWSEQETSLNLAVSGFGPVTLYCNEQEIFKTNILNERFEDHRSMVSLKLIPGWNSLVLKFTKTAAGFGGRVGTSSPKSLPLHFLMPSMEREGQEGWVFTSPLDKPLTELPRQGMSEAETELRWWPEKEWSIEKLQLSPMQRLWDLPKDKIGIAWTRVVFPHVGLYEYRLKGYHDGPIQVYVGGRNIYQSDNSGKIDVPCKSSFGKQDLLVVAKCKGSKWGFELNCYDKEVELESVIPYPVRGAKDNWLYCGPLDEPERIEPDKLQSMDCLLEDRTGKYFWQLDLPEMWVRPYREGSNFGRWNYPLGVTLYGLLQAGRLLGRETYGDYVKQHVEQCTAQFQYAFWDKERYGAAGILNLLTTIDSLDDCGSFGSLMLDLAQTQTVVHYQEIADFIGDYIGNKQARLSDGALVRRKSSYNFMDETLWADDLYMSVPFLCRYYRLTGEQRYINEAARQLLLYHHYLYIPEHKIMSHVYDFKIGQATKVPWGRGNGWVIFSLAELLTFLPQDHPERTSLLKIFEDLCNGYAALQDEEGLWHQVLTDPESYPETSCTSMFIYAFSRGVRNDWLQEKDKYLKAALKGWRGLSRTAIDAQGNIYGVCRGSGFSFTADYYKNDLSWRLNDTHGIGIVMLAGVELLKTMKQFEVAKSVDQSV